MKNQCSTQQLSFNFEFEQVSTVQKESKCLQEQPKPKAVQTKAPVHFSKADFEEILAIENDLINGRGAWLYAQLERELEHERKAARALKEFEALRAESYKYNF